MKRVRSLVVAFVVAFSVLAWATDFVTLQDESIVYTVDCRDGRWEGDRCIGALVAGQRYRFRVLKPRREVLFWVVGSTQPSGRYVNCDIQGGRNWSCKDVDQSSRTVTLGMVHGYPAGGLGQANPAHVVHKLRWLLTRAGVPTGHTAADAVG